MVEVEEPSFADVMKVDSAAVAETGGYCASAAASSSRESPLPPSPL